jgi:predicted MPP superfamily phosphohydrolase
LLPNTHAFLYKGTDSIAVIGVENSGAPPFPDFSDLPAAMDKIPNGIFKVLLTHDPTHWRREVLNTNIHLTLSGHTHAFQVALGGFSPASFRYREWGGMYREGRQALYVNAGIGSVFIPFRFGAWPEITVIHLKQDKL